MTNNSLTSREKYIRGDEPACGGIIVAALEIVPARLLVVDVAPVAEQLVFAQCSCQGAGSGEDLSPTVVHVFYHRVVAAVNQLDNVSLSVT